MQDQTPQAPSGGPGTVAGTTQPDKPEQTSLVQKLEIHGPAIVGVVVLMIVAWILGGWARTASRRALSKTKFDPTLGKFASNLLRWVILTLAVLTSLSLFGVQATSFAAVIGAVTLAIGLGFQNSLSNLAAGVMLLIFRPFKVGDVVNIGGQLGKVNEIDLMMTELDTPDGRRIFVPNGQIFGNVIENITHHPRRRVDVEVGVDYAADIDRTRAALERAVQMIEPKLVDPAPEVVLVRLGASSVDWALRIWTARDHFVATQQAGVRCVKYALDEAGISIPFTTFDINLRGTGGERSVRLLLPETQAAESVAR